MILAQDRWNAVFKFFTEEERVEIFRHKTCQTRSTFVVDETQLSPRLVAKLRFHFDKKTARLSLIDAELLEPGAVRKIQQKIEDEE